MLSSTKLARAALLITSIIALLSPSLSAIALANQTCYYPDGSIAQGDKPCGNGTDVACCGSGGICLSNGLCMDVAQPNTLARSSCTDKTWNSGNCPNYCLQGQWWAGSNCLVSHTKTDFFAQIRVSIKVVAQLFSFHSWTARPSTAVTTWTPAITHPSAHLTTRLSKYPTRVSFLVTRFCRTTPTSRMLRLQLAITLKTTTMVQLE